MSVTSTQFVSNEWCQYCGGFCQVPRDAEQACKAFFVYPSTPNIIAETVRSAAAELKRYASQSQWRTWEDLSIPGQVIFCKICQAIRSAEFIVANITSLNFNVLFEIGYAIGLAKPILPVRDTSYNTDKGVFDEIGLFDTLGYTDFTNSQKLRSEVSNFSLSPSLLRNIAPLDRRQPIYYVKTPVENDGSIRISSELKKSVFRFRTFDPREHTRLSLYEAVKQVSCSSGVLAHLMSPERSGATAHNSRCAFVAGLAMAMGKHVLLFQEGTTVQPIDYRDVVTTYTTTTVIRPAVEKFVRANTKTIIDDKPDPALPSAPQRLLEQIDMGDIAAENEIQALSSQYFVKTPLFLQTRQGHARLVIGRKGSGKSALFYGLRNYLSDNRNRLILDLKPDGHQFLRFREVVLAKMSEGLQEHTVTAFWHYLLVLEIVRKVLDRESKTAWQSPETLKAFESLKQKYDALAQGATEGDFSERLMALVNRLADAAATAPIEQIGPTMTQLIYAKDISDLERSVGSRDVCRDGIWILFDNIDKGFPTNGLKREDTLIVRGLLEATRKIQRQFQKKGSDCTSVVCIRHDVFDLLVDHTPDRGKESAVYIDWSDECLLQNLLDRRFTSSAPSLRGDFWAKWHQICDAHVGGQCSFHYILERTLQRPRDILNFVRKAIQIAVSRSHQRVLEEDIVTAEREYSEDIFNELKYEFRDIYPQFSDLLINFLGSEPMMSRDDITLYAMEAGISEELTGDVLYALLWFCVLGIESKGQINYAYDMKYNSDRLNKMMGDIGSDRRLVLHPAFRKALMIGEGAS